MNIGKKEKKKKRQKIKMNSYRQTFQVKDEYPTPKMLVEIILPYLKEWADNFEKTNKRKPIIWCPFDKDFSNYVKLFTNKGYKVEYSHIDDGKDFFEYEPKKWDIAISNPPFSLKLKIFEKLCSNKKPFAMLMNMMSINYQEIGNFFYKVGTDIQFLIPDKKVSYDGNTSSFCSGYVCYKFLDKTTFVHLEHNNTHSKFIKE